MNKNNIKYKKKEKYLKAEKRMKKEKNNKIKWKIHIYKKSMKDEKLK